MSKALVIKGANFAINKVETISLSNPIPCEGITLSQSTISASALGVAATLTATLTPADTTEQVVWSSSDEDVATVSNGVVTVVGVGTATITAACGTQSATCIVTASITINLDSAFHALNGYVYSGSLDLPTKDYVGLMVNSRGRLYYSTEEYGTYRAFVGESEVGKYAIPIPNGATKITIMAPQGLQSYMAFVLLDVNSKQTYISGADGNAALGIHAYTASNITDSKIIDFSEYPSANGFIMDVRTPSGGDPSAVTGETLVTFE